MSDDLVNRLRCRYPIGQIVNGDPEFGWREFGGHVPAGAVIPMPIHIEAAERIETMLAELNALRKFAGTVLADSREFGEGVSYGDVLDLAVELGLMAVIDVVESCGDECLCDEVTYFPTTCVVYTDIGRAAVDAAQKP